jgi:hypothetical protein
MLGEEDGRQEQAEDRKWNTMNGGGKQSTMETHPWQRRLPYCQSGVLPPPRFYQDMAAASPTPPSPLAKMGA